MRILPWDFNSAGLFMIFLLLEGKRACCEEIKEEGLREIQVHGTFVGFGSHPPPPIPHVPSDRIGNRLPFTQGEKGRFIAKEQTSMVDRYSV